MIQISEETSDLKALIQDDIARLQQTIDTAIEHLAVEKKTKYAELKKLFDASNAAGETPPNVVIASLLATLRRVYNMDQLVRLKFQLHELSETAGTLDDLPYLWNR